MTDAHAQAAPATIAGWGALLRDGRAVYSALICIGVSLHAVDIFVIATVMPSLVADIGGVAFYTWPAMLYVVASVVGAACGAYMRAAMGWRRACAVGGLVFMAGTVGCAMAPSMAVVLVARLVQGFGAGLTMALSMALISELYPDALRQRIMAAVNIVWTVAALIGPTFAGIFAEWGSWRAAFWATMPLSAWFVVVAWRKLPPSDTARNLPRLPIERLILLALGVVSVAAVGRVESLPLQAVLIVAAVSLIWFTFQRDNDASSRLFPRGALDVFSAAGMAYWIVICISIAYATVTLFLPLVLQAVHGAPPLFAGYFNMLLSIMWSVGAFLVAGMIGVRRDAAMIVGAALTAIGAAGLAIGGAESPIWYLAIFATCVGLGIGANNVLLFTWIMARAAKGEETVAASSLPVMRSLGVAFGSALSGVIANSAGLDRSASAETVTHAIYWIFGFDVIPALITTALTVWLVIAARAHTRNSATR